MVTKRKVVNIFSKRVIPFLAEFIPRAALSILLGTALFMIGFLGDYYYQKGRPGTDFVQYTQFTVQNARVNEDVNFTVCRSYDMNYQVDANIRVYVLDTKNPEAKPREVFGRTQQDTLEGNCDNKVIENRDYAHLPGRYELRLCVDFEVRHRLPKQVCLSSNVYTIYDTPGSLQEQLETLKRQQAELERQIRESNNISASQPSSQGSTGTTQRQSAQSQPSTPQNTSNQGSNGNQNSGGNQGGNGGSTNNPTPTPPACTVTLLGLGVLCF